ncbi:MAG: phospholipid carrier-dependent glycosyltransferase [Actinomycetes bacterium]
MPQLLVRRKDLYSSLGFGLLALIFRLWHLGTPKGYIFDEVYYAKNARSLLLHGVEIDPKTHSAEFIVHPPIGKWLISLGIKIFGYNEFGWRFSAALFGSVSVVLIYWVTKKLFNNYFLSCAAAILMLADGLHLVHSRVALLDLFLMFFILLAFLFILHSKHWWAGVSLGLAAATKWSGAYYIIAYAAFILYVDYRNYRALEVERPFTSLLKEKLGLRTLQYAFLPIVVYLFSWVGWFATKTGWDRTWADSRKSSFWSFVPAPLRSFWHYHSEILGFHQGLTTKHPYSANPWSWLILGRPTSFFYDAPNKCGAPSCAREVLALGTPLLWWAGILGILVTFGYWISRREWQSGLILLSVGAGYLPWFLFQKRTMFEFYAIAFEPFIILILIYCVAKFMEVDDPALFKRRRAWVIAAIVLVVANFLYFLPIFIGSPIPYPDWLSRMWLPSWI